MRFYRLIFTDSFVQLRNVEDRMYHARGWQLEPVCNSANTVFDLKGTIKTERELVVGARRHKRLDVGLKSKINLVANLKLTLSAFLVGLGLHPLLDTGSGDVPTTWS